MLFGKFVMIDQAQVKRSILVMVLIAVLAVPLARAPFALAQSDTGSITVTGSVAPAPTTITTAVTTTSASPISQNQEVEYTISYSSTNVTTVPLHLVAKWDKGTVDGATEANVDVVEYVLGSATQGYGNTSPVIDVLSKSISWDIPALSSGAGTQQLRFKLRTTANYTGDRLVSFPVSVVVISPVGVPDRRVSRDYRYLNTFQNITPTPSPTVTGQSGSSTQTQTATSAAQSSVSAGSGNVFESVSFPAVGASSARIRVTTTSPIGMVISYGSDPANLENRIALPASSLTQDFVLINLQPQTEYFFRISDADNSFHTDLFSFETASRLVEQESLSMNVTMTQERNVVYFGPPTSTISEDVLPIIVTKNSLIDITLKLPNNASVKQIEAFIRNTSVLGVSTEELNLDDLQSSTTKLAKVGDDLYVGKLRVPESSGSYDVVSRIEDIYGNVIEREVQLLSVVQPFRVVEQVTKKPLSRSKVVLSLFNPDTRLYQVVSNVTSNINNPSFSDSDGSVDFILLPARYRAVVSAPGYKDQTVDFEISTVTGDYPLVLMEKNSWIAISSVQSTVGFLKQTSEEIVQGLLSLSRIQDYYNVTLFMTGAFLVVLLMLTLVIQRHPHFSIDELMLKYQAHYAPKVAIAAGFLFIQALRFFSEVLVFHTFVFGVTFLFTTEPRQGILLLGIGTLEVILLCYNYLLTKYRSFDTR